MFDYIWNLLPTNEKELNELINQGVIYTPYVPLQITKLNLKENMTMFHAKDGWYFEKLEDGSVHIFKGKQQPVSVEMPEMVILEEVTVDKYVWASIIASMSERGEDNNGFYGALDFHMKKK